ncbi:MAG: sel1 repeat family protein [Clostridiaceae bacterium]|nr:sel1 repeat family protein [Clostridiaceae bacterium]
MSHYRGMTDGVAAEMAECLHRLSLEFGSQIWHKPRLIRNLMADIYPDDRRLINCLHISVQSGLPQELLLKMRESNGVSTAQIRRFEASLHDDYGLAWQYARWLVQVWESLFCVLYDYRNSRPLLQVATRAEVRRMLDMLPYYYRLERFEEYHQTAEALCRLNQAEGYHARGICYLQGLNVVANDTEAFKSFLLAAEMGLDRAQYAAAVCYELGRGCVVSYGKAAALYEKAAGQGYTDAAEQLGELRRIFVDSMS